MRYHVALLALLITATVSAGKPKTQRVGGLLLHEKNQPKKSSSFKRARAIGALIWRAIRNKD